MSSNRIVNGAGVTLLVLVVWGLMGCGGQQETTVVRDQKLLVIGVDSADWALWRPMLDEGRLPNLRKFMGEAAYGRMKTFYPLEKSPLLWASICTGVLPEVHGIDNFVRGDDQKPVSGSAWYAPALWDMLGAVDRSTAVVGMWTTYPARPINGVMVSDYLPYGHGRERALANLVAPDSLSEVVSALRVDPDALGADELGRFIDGTRLAELETKYPEDIAKLRSVHAADLGYLATSRLLAQKRDFDLFFFYLRGPDAVSHHFYEFLKPENLGRAPDPEKMAAFGELVRNYYDWSDEVIGEVLSWFPPDRQAVIVSDHGFYGPRRSGNKGTAEHSEWGVFLVRSPLYAAGQQFGHLELLDVCPTLLALLGLPPAKDMPGAILAEALTAAGQKRVPNMENQRVDSYLPLRPAAGPAGERDEAVDEEIRKQLRSLGYIN
jgi:predicted AlkP superfamily phosphohydrolase/phosphomutase